MGAALTLAAALLLGPAPLAGADKDAAFRAYIEELEMRMEAGRNNPGRFLWMDASPARRQKVMSGEVAIEPGTSQNGLRDTGNALIHHWTGAVFLPGATLDRTLAIVQDYDRHHQHFGPEVAASRLLQRDGDSFRIHLRLRKHKVITVMLNTEHDVRYFRLAANRAHSRSYSTRIREIEDAGTPKEKELAPGKDHGFLWQLYSYWRFEERDNGVVVECEAVSLTRDVPTGLGWLVTPIIRDLPRESLAMTLNGTRRAVTGR